MAARRRAPAPGHPAILGSPRLLAASRRPGVADTPRAHAGPEPLGPFIRRAARRHRMGGQAGRRRRGPGGLAPKPRFRSPRLGAARVRLGHAARCLARATGVLRALLRVKLTQRVNELVLGKALTLELGDFENAEFYDRMSRVQRDVTYRPLQLVQGALALLEGSVALLGYAALLLGFSPWILLLLTVAALPAFVAEAQVQHRRVPALSLAIARRTTTNLHRDRARAR